MADYEPRRDFRGGGGGGGYGGGRNNKRKRYREDDEYDQGNFRNQRQRQDAPPGTKIRKALLEIGEDFGRDPQEVASHIASLVADNYKDEYVKDVFLTVGMKLLNEQPFKLPFVTAVVLYVNDLKSEAAADFVGKVVESLQEMLDTGKWRGMKLMLRFLACVGSFFEQDGIVPILEELFNRAVDLQTASPDDVVGIELVKIILYTIPYLVAGNNTPSTKQLVSELLEKTGIVASAPHPLTALVDPYPAENAEDKAMACASVISLLQQQLQHEAANDWPLACLPKVYDAKRTAHRNGDQEMNGDSSQTKIPFPAITVPSPISAGEGLLFPEIYFSVYADQDIESVPPTSNVASSLIRDAILDTVNVLDFNRNAAAKFLTEIDSFWAPGSFVRHGTAFDKLKDMPEGQRAWKTEDVAIDAIFSQLFQMPAPRHKLVYYHSLITELCKISPAHIAPSLGRAIRFLYRHIGHMDLELAYRFMEWFAHHLSNFEFRWKWQEWVDDLTLSNLHPRKAFIEGALEKEIQLSFAKRVRDTLPEPYHVLISSSKEQEIPEFKFRDDRTPFAKEGQEVLALLKKKAPEEEIQPILDSVHEQATANGFADPLVASTDIYITCILSIGSKSISHVLATVDRCKERLLTVGSKSELARRQVITSVVDFWKDHPGTAVKIVDKLLNYAIITPHAVIEWCLGDQMDRGRSLASSQIYEMIAVTMGKVTNRLRQVVRERSNLSLSYDQREQLDQALPRERQGMRDLFSNIEDAVASVASGTNDEMIEGYDDGNAERDLIIAWGTRWLRAWRRKAAVEEAIVGEGIVGPLQEAPAPQEDEPVAEVLPLDEDMDQEAA